MLAAVALFASFAAAATPTEALAAGRAKFEAGGDPYAVTEALAPALLAPDTIEMSEREKLWELVALNEQKLAATEPYHYVYAYDAVQKCKNVVREAILTTETRQRCLDLEPALAPGKDAWNQTGGKLPSLVMLVAFRANDAGDASKAGALAKLVADAAPDTSDAWYLLGLSKFNMLVATQKTLSSSAQTTMLKESRAAFEKAHALAPKDSAVLDGLVVVCGALKDSAAVGSYKAKRAALDAPAPQ